MGIINNTLDFFKKAEFSVSPGKKLKTISSEFKKSFQLSLVFYKGNLIAEGDLTLTGLNNKTSATIKKNTGEELKIRANMKVKEVEKLFLEKFGTKVQIKDSSAKNLIDDNLTLGDAIRKS